MALNRKSYEEAKAAYKPLKRSRMSNSSHALKTPSTQPGRPKRGILKATVDPELAAWGRRVKKRDGNRCQWPDGCRTGDTRMDPHHLAPRGRRPDLRYDDSNGLTLCRTHHAWIGDHPIEAEDKGLLSSETYEAALKEKQ